MTDEEILAHVPSAPPAGMVEWLKKQAAWKREYLIYRASWETDPLTGIKEKKVAATCSACGKRMIMDYVPGPACAGYAPAPFGFFTGKESVISGNDFLCPVCGAQVKARHIGNSFPCEEWTTVLEMQGHGDTAVAVCWMMIRNIHKDGTAEIRPWMYECYVTRGRQMVRVAGHQRYMQADFQIQPEVRKRMIDGAGGMEYLWPVDEKELDGTPWENAKIELYMEDDGTQVLPISYLRGYLKKPQVENLLVQGLGHLVRESVQNDCQGAQYYGCGGPKAWKFTGFDMKEKSPAKMLGVTKPELQRLKALGWDIDKLKIWQRLRRDQSMSLEQMEQAFKVLTKTDIHEIAKDGGNVSEAVRYIQRQKKRDSRASWRMLEDYHRMAKRQRIALDCKKLLWPDNLMREHDRLAELEQRQLQEKKRAEIAGRAQRFAELAKAYAAAAYNDGKICIRIAAKETELIAEGAKLKHCVGGYGAGHVAGRSIFFVRRAEAPDEPWYTLNVNLKDGSIIQLHGYENDRHKPVPEEVRRFCRDWVQNILLPVIAEANKKKSKKKKADAA